MFSVDIDCAPREHMYSRLNLFGVPEFHYFLSVVGVWERSPQVTMQNPLINVITDHLPLGTGVK